MREINGYGGKTKTGLRAGNPWLPVGLFFGLWMTAVGCGGGSAPQGPSVVKPPAAKVPAPPIPVVESKAQAPAVPAPPPYAYNPEARRDPFRSILVTSETGKTLESLPPLLRTEVGELRLIGIVWGGLGNSAMVQTPDGKGYTIRVGTLIGPNNGSVRQITNRYLVIEEKYTDVFGEKKAREIKLELHPQKEGSE